MRALLDNTPLDGPTEVRINYRPEREAVPLAGCNTSDFVEMVAEQCQYWSGATAPIIPLDSDGFIQNEYQNILTGSTVDGLRGTDYFSLASRARLKPDRTQRGWWGKQLAAAALKYGRQSEYATLQVVELANTDPWQGIYAACLGSLPDRPIAELLEASRLESTLRFEDIVHVERVQATGSLEDLLQRQSDDRRLTPRQLSMVHLSYGNSGSRGIRTGPGVLPSRAFARQDAGPNIVVACRRDSVEDLALLWNLRAALGDHHVLPIGIPIEFLNARSMNRVLGHERISRNGMPHYAIYVTSASVSERMMNEALSDSGDPDDRRTFAVRPMEELLDLGHGGGWHRSEVLMWKHGRADLTPLPSDSHAEVFRTSGLHPSVRMTVDVSVPTHPFPVSARLRIPVANGAFHGGQYSLRGTSIDSRASIRSIEWPSRMLIAKGVASRLGYELRASEAGIACQVLLEGMEDPNNLYLLAHAPILELAEAMSVRQGFGWYKERLRARDEQADPADAVPPSVEDLADFGFNAFKKALDGREYAARNWLFLAERNGLVVKGFRMKCANCAAKQWVAVAAFAPPVTCNGCSRRSVTPFHHAHTFSFTYRLSEKLRRVFEVDAVGHLLATRFLDKLIGQVDRGVVGFHMGMEVRHDNSPTVVGEADVLVLTSTGDFVPFEVKRRANGLSSQELIKLDRMMTSLQSPWSGVVACEYSIRSSTSDLAEFVELDDAGQYRRVVLTFDRLLDPHPVWPLGGDPFLFEQLDEEAINDREKNFVAGLSRDENERSMSWLESDFTTDRYSNRAAEEG